MGKRNDKVIPSRPSAEELRQIDKLVSLLKERGEPVTRSRVMINAAIEKLTREINTELQHEII